jgi:uncharacterized protein (DUF58 family)
MTIDAPSPQSSAISRRNNTLGVVNQWLLRAKGLNGMGMTPTAAIAVAGVAALIVVLPLALVLAGIAAVLVMTVVDALAVRRQPEAERMIPAVISRGIPASFQASVAHRSARRLTVRQPLPPDVVSLITSTGNGSRVTVCGTVTALRRGTHAFAPLAVRADGPLGLGRWYHEALPTTSVEAHADLPTAYRLALAVRRGAIRPTGERRRGPLGLGTEFESLREYRPDDDSRLINWRATARLGKPTSNNLRVEQDQSLIIAIDCGRLQASALAAAGVEAPPGATVTRSRGLFAVPPWAANRLDAALDVLSALALVADELSDRCGMVAFADTVIADIRPVRRGSRLVLRQALRLNPVNVDSDCSRAMAVAESFRPTVLVICTDIIDPASVEPLLISLNGLAARRRVLVISPDDLLESGEHSAATQQVLQQMARDRSAAISMVRSTGAAVITGRADRIAELAVRGYLNSRLG